MLLISKCRGDRDLSLCTTSVTAAQNPIFPASKRLFFLESRHCAAVLQTQVPKLCTDLDLSLLYILILGTYSKSEKYFPSSRRLLSAALLELWLHVCRVKITFTVLSMNCFVSTTKNSMKSVVNWIPLRIRVRARNTQHHLKLGLGVSRTNADSQWNPVYNAFHRFFCCGNETISSVVL